MLAAGNRDYLGAAMAGAGIIPGIKGGRGGNHLRPDPKATGPHSSFRRDADGKITNTAT